MRLNKSAFKSSLGGKSERITLVDEVIRKAKKTPGPGHFNPKYNNKVKGSVKLKGDRGTFLDECEYVGLSLPAPGNYNPNFNAISKHSSAPKYKNVSKVAEDWRPKKKFAPDCGSYDYWDSYKKVSKRTGTAIISKSVIKPFNEEAAYSKRLNPAVGTYDPEKAYSKISRPMKSGRR